MDFEELMRGEFLLSLGYVTVIASILTVFIMQLYKMILKKRKVLTDDMDKDKKDSILSKAGRAIALIMYCLLYLGNEYYLKHNIAFSDTLIIGLLSGGTATLTVAKGLYTSLRQHQKKKDVFDKLEQAQEALKKIQNRKEEKSSKIILSYKKENRGNENEQL